MACSETGSSGGLEPIQANDAIRKPRILLAASGSVAAMRFGNLCHNFSCCAEVKAVATRASLHFIDRTSLPKDVILYTDEDEWSSWNKMGDNVLQIELRRWADVMVIAPLSVNTLGKIAEVLCDNLVTCLAHGWDYKKPLFVAPAMSTFMWNNPFTERHLMTIDDQGISLIPPSKGEMAALSVIYSTVMACCEPEGVAWEPIQGNPALIKPRILLAASGCVAATKFAHLCRSFLYGLAEVRVVVSRAAFHFIDRASLAKDVVIYTDEDEWSSWNTIGDNMLSIELRGWADIMVIAPLSANTLAKIARGLCDNLLSSVVYAWDYSKPLFVAPAMNTLMWNNPFTKRQIKMIRDELGISVILPLTKNGAMAETDLIHSTVKHHLQSVRIPKGHVGRINTL